MPSTFQTRLLHRVLTLLPDARPLDRRVIDEAAVPANIKYFILRILDRRLTLEEASFTPASSEWFDLSSPDVSKSFTLYLDLVRSTARIPATETTPMVRQAIEQVSRYVERPVGTVLDFIFQKDSGSIATESALRRAGYFRDYSHLIIAVSASIDRAKKDHIDRNDIRKALEGVDRAITNDFSGDDWVEHLSPLLELHAFDGEYPDRIGLDSIVHSFRDRGREDLAESLLRAASRTENLAISGRDDPVDREHESGGALVPHAALGPLIQAAIDLKTPVEDVEVPLWKRFAGDVGTDTSGQSGTVENEPVPLWQTFADANKGRPEAGHDRTASDDGRAITEQEPPVAGRTESGPSDPESRFEQVEKQVLGDSVNRTQEFQMLLFDNERDVYLDVLTSLASAASWADASRIIGQQVFLRFGTDIYSELAVAFTDAIERRYTHD